MSNAQREYYVTDLIAVYRSRGMVVDAMIVADPREILGVNSRRELANVTAILKSAKNQTLHGWRRDAGAPCVRIHRL